MKTKTNKKTQPKKQPAKKVTPTPKKTNRGSKPGVARGPYKKTKANEEPKKNTDEAISKEEAVKSIPHVNPVESDGGLATPVGNVVNNEDKREDSGQVTFDNMDWKSLEDEFNQQLENPEVVHEDSSQPATGDSNPTETITQEVKETPKIVVPGSTLILLMNSVLPYLAMTGVRLMSKGKLKVDPKDLKLDADEREMLEPLADAAAAQILGSMNPVHLFAITAIALYAGKITASIQKVEVSQDELINS